MVTPIIEKPFDTSRAMLEDYMDAAKFPGRLVVDDAQRLSEAVDSGQVTTDTMLLTFQRDNNLYALPMSLIVSHNVVQNSEPYAAPWIMTFCIACNTGIVFNPMVDGQRLNFRRRGAYNGMLLIYDDETATYWHHITGEAVHGSSQGKRLKQISGTRQMTVAEALTHPNAYLFLHALTPEQEKMSAYTEKLRANPDRALDGIMSTVSQEDTRRPRFDEGIGLWDGTTSLFVPCVLLQKNNNVFQIELRGRRVLIYQHADAITPSAVYLDAPDARWEGDILRLDADSTIHNDVYITAEGPQVLSRPMQLVMRWYGFALTFPGCEMVTEPAGRRRVLA